MIFGFQINKIRKRTNAMNCGRLPAILCCCGLLIYNAAAQIVDSTVVNSNDSTVSARDQTDAARHLTLAEAIDAAQKQASALTSAQINEQIAAQDVIQAKAAFYPKIAAAPSVIYTTPSLGRTTTAGVTEGNFAAITSRPPSFLGANAVSEFQGLVTTAGEIDVSGRLKANLRRNRLLLEAARSGSEISRRELVNAVSDAYFNFALATLKRRGAENNLRSAADFENNLKLQLDAGEVAPVDLVRARLQTAQRRDELAQSQTDESINGDALRVLIGYDFTQPIAVEDLLTQTPDANEINRYTETAISTRPEFAQFEAARLAAEQDIEIARADRRVQLTYSVSTGFISDSLRPNRIKDSAGVQASIGVSIPLFDKGASRSRETQARLRIAQAANDRAIAERQFVQAFYTARTQAIAAAARIREIGRSITDAETNLTVSIARYRAGEAQIVEITDADNLLAARRLALYQAIFDYQTARSRLLRAIGQ